MAGKNEWVITAAPDHPITEIAKTASAAGFAADQVLEEIGCIIGRGDDKIAAKLRTIPGVADVSPSAGIDIGPPGSPDTW